MKTYRYPPTKLRIHELDGFTCKRCGNFIRCYHLSGITEAPAITFCEECLIDTLRDSDTEISIHNDQYFGSDSYGPRTH